MASISIELSKDRFERLEALARKLSLRAEDLVRASVDALLDRPDEEFARMREYVLEKNRELYRRLS